MDKNYKLNFTIPQGPTGPAGVQGETGPTGPSGEKGVGLQAYGGIYNDQGNQLNIPANQLYVLVFPSTMPKYNMTYQGIDSFIIEEDGTYEISYGFIFAVNNIVYNSVRNCTLRLRANGVDIPGSVITITVKNSDQDSIIVYNNVFNSVIADLKSQDNIYLHFSSDNDITISLPESVNTIMTIKKLN